MVLNTTFQSAKKKKKNSKGEILFLKDYYD